MAEYSPMMQQYFITKENYKDCILMYRLGDFYEMFFEDAKIASSVLELVLTGRDCGQEERAPMCGVPFHAVDSYVAKLVEHGYNVAICEQLEDPKKAKGIVKRDVIRVVTPGTIMDTNVLDDKKNNYLCSIYISDDNAGISFADITTGEISANEFFGDDIEMSILNEMSKFAPAEVIVNLKAFENDEFMEKISDRFGCKIQNFYNWAFDYEEALTTVQEQFRDNYDDLNFKDKKACICSLGALLSYLKEMQKAELLNIKGVDVLDETQYMNIDIYSMRNLELMETMREKKSKGSLLDILNKTKTSMGSRLMRKWISSPLLNCALIQNRHNAVEEMLTKPIAREEIIEKLSTVQDIERIIGKVAYKTANCKDLLAIASSLSFLPDIKEILGKCESGVFGNIFKNFDTLDDVRELIENSINPEAPITLREGNLIKDGYNEEIDSCRKAMKDGINWIKEFAEQEKEKTGIKNIKVGYNRVFGYYLEISKQQADMVPDYFVRKQTLSNGERYITPKIKEIEEMIVDAESKFVSMEYDVFCEIRDRVAAQVERIQKTAQNIAVIDVLCSLAYVAEKNKYIKPNMNMSDTIDIKDGRHPVVEKINKTNMFIPNDVRLDCSKSQISIITGPNMAGKSTYMRQTALIVLMAQIGSFVPASYAEVGIIDKIFTRVGASDDLSAGQSTFMVEMKEVSYILNNATNKSLIILDEIGRGTSTFDGLSIAWSVVEYIADKKKCGAKTLFATHYHELTELEERISSVKNYCIAVKKRGDDITFLRKIIRGGADGSYGIEVAALAGVKKEVTKRAKQILKALEERDSGAEPPEIKIRTAKPEQINENQMNFLGMADNEVMTDLKKLNLDTMTPMEALTILYSLKAKAENIE